MAAGLAPGPEPGFVLVAEQIAVVVAAAEIESEGLIVVAVAAVDAVLGVAAVVVFDVVVIVVAVEAAAVFVEVDSVN